MRVSIYLNFSALLGVIELFNHFVKSNLIHDHHCSSYMEQCDISYSQPCCNINHECKSIGWGAFRYELRCVQIVRLGESCESHFDCQGINFAECSNNKKCKCEKNFTTVGDSKCLSPLNSFCISNSDCLLENATCVNSQCTSEIDLVITSNKDTSYLKDFCKLDSDCDNVLHAKCSNTNKCVCRANNILVNSSVCMPMMDAFCWKDEPCANDNAVCSDNTCQCRAGFKFFPQINSCIEFYLGMPCQTSSECKGIRNAECYKNHKCFCKEGSIMLNETVCALLLNAYCENNDECLLSNSECIDNKCRCKPKYSNIKKLECQLDQLGKFCDSNVDCINLHYAECVVNRCNCMPNTLAINKTSCLSVLGGYCFRDDHCLPKNSHCNLKRCKCKPEYVPNSIDRCVSG